MSNESNDDAEDAAKLVAGINAPSKLYPRTAIQFLGMDVRADPLMSPNDPPVMISPGGTEYINGVPGPATHPTVPDDQRPRVLSAPAPALDASGDIYFYSKPLDRLAFPAPQRLRDEQMRSIWEPGPEAWRPDRCSACGAKSKMYEETGPLFGIKTQHSDLTGWMIVDYPLLDKEQRVDEDLNLCPSCGEKVAKFIAHLTTPELHEEDLL